MKKGMAVLLAMGMISVASAVNLINTDFTGYTDGNITLTAPWEIMPETGADSFSVDGTAGIADSAPYASSFTNGLGTNGHYVYVGASNTVGNVIDDEWSGVMDFSLSTTAAVGTNIAEFANAHEIYQIGLTDAATNRINVAQAGDFAINLRRRSAGDGEMQVTFSKAGNFQTLGFQ